MTRDLHGSATIPNRCGGGLALWHILVSPINMDKSQALFLVADQRSVSSVGKKKFCSPPVENTPVSGKDHARTLVASSANVVQEAQHACI